MIRPLRERHRQVMAIASIVLPIAFGMGIAARKPIPETDKAIAGLEDAPSQALTRIKSSAPFRRSPVRVDLLRLSSASNRFAVRLQSDPDFLKPDLIVYWTRQLPEPADRLPNDALLLGAFDSSPFPLPERAETSPGALILYSLADNEIVDISEPLVVPTE